MSDWLERELKDRLSAVSAPASLWDRIQDGRPPRRNRSLEWMRWPTAAALTLVIAGATVWQFARAHGPVTGMQALALEELQAMSSDPQRLDFRSGDSVAIGDWVKTEANIALHLPSGNSAVRLLGVRMIERGGAPIAAIAYQVAGARAALLVSRSATGGRPAPPKHTFAKVDSGPNGIYSWSMGPNVYALVCSAKDPQAACLLCHATAVN